MPQLHPPLVKLPGPLHETKYVEITKHNYFLSDINECENGEADCAPHSECVNVQGAYYCQCDKGFWGHCDACEGNEYMKYFKSTGRQSEVDMIIYLSYIIIEVMIVFLTDIDECATGLDTCHQDALCLNNEVGCYSSSILKSTYSSCRYFYLQKNYVAI